MIIKIELDDLDVEEIIFQLRMNARLYAARHNQRAYERCLLIACRIENQQNAQRVTDHQYQDKDEVK